MKLEFGYIRSVLAASTSPFGINFVPSVVLLFTNYFAMRTGGTAAVSAYAVMSYAVYTMDYVFQGVCDGVQPIISYCCGAGDRRSKIDAVRKSSVVLAVFATVFVAATPLLIWGMPKLFSASGDAGAMMRDGFLIYAASYPFKAVVKFIGSYYYACGRIKRSNFLIYIDPVVLTPLFLVTLPRALGINGVWWSFTLAQIVVAALGGISLRYKKEVYSNE